MWAKFLLVFLSCFGMEYVCVAATLHVGNNAILLSNLRNTSPALGVNLNGEISWGALFPDTAPLGALRINVWGTQYWLGEYCASGTYLSVETGKCTDCGFGHYCMGGRHRAACSGGIIGCPGINATSDVASPEFANRMLTNAEIADITPITDLASHWRQVSCCSSGGDYYDALYKDLSLVNSVQGCANMVLHPGTYLFIARSGPGSCLKTDPFTGNTGGYFAQMAIFDHVVSYKTIHAYLIYYHFIDVDSPEFTDWDFRAPTEDYCNVSIPDKITGLDAVPRQLCVYELR